MGGQFPVAGTKKNRGGGEWGGMEEDPLYMAIGAITMEVPAEDLVGKDGAWEGDALKKRLFKCFKTAAKGLSFDHEDKAKLIRDYTDYALNDVAWCLEGTKWIQKA